MTGKQSFKKYDKKIFFTVEFFEDFIEKCITSIYYSIRLYLERNIYIGPNYFIHTTFNNIEKVVDYYHDAIIPFAEVILFFKKSSFSRKTYLKTFYTSDVKKGILFFLWILCYPFKPLAYICRNYFFNLVYGKNI